MVARLVDPQHLGTSVICRSEARWASEDGALPQELVEVELSGGVRRSVPLANLEILKAR